MLSIYIKKPSTFRNIMERRKTIEGRLYRGVFKNLKRGDNINFCKGNETIKAKVININKYDSFRNMLINEEIDKILPDVQGYRGWYKYL
tara:strand:+ start:162 stop:428 length:267 start_codon:yes stop_codon:yes gene_type:complete